MIQTQDVQRACMVFATTVVATGSAQADHFSIHALLAGDVALTDNEFSVPSSLGPEPDLFVDVRPGVMLMSEGTRFIEQLLAQAEVIEYARHLDEPSYNAFGSWKGILLPGPRTDMVFQVDGATGQTNALTARNTSDQATIQVQQSGPASLRSADALENLGYQATKETRVIESGFAQWAATDDNQPMPTTTNSFSGGGGIGVQRLFRHDTVGIDVGVTYLRLEEIAPVTMTTGLVPLVGSHLQHQLNPRADITWLHDFGRKWSGGLLAGLVYVNQIGIDPYAPQLPVAGATAYPVFSALVGYTDVWGHALLNVGRGVAPDLFIAENTLNDSAIVQAAIPLYWLEKRPTHEPRLALLGSAGVVRTQLLDSESGGTLGQFDVGLLDVGIQWTQSPGRVWGVRYELMIQHGDQAASVIEPSFYRDTLFFTFNLRYPDDVTPKLPNTGQSVRSDRSDIAPATSGAEPVVPDPVDPAPTNDATPSP
jgi:hypothetical protein